MGPLDDKEVPSFFTRVKFRVRNNDFIYRKILNFKYRTGRHVQLENSKLDEVVSELSEYGISVRKIEDVFGKEKGSFIIDKSLEWLKLNENNLEQNRVKKFLWNYFPTQSNKELDLNNPIIQFYTSTFIIYVASKYLGYIPQMNEITIQKTTSNYSDTPIQSQKWHRDPQEMRTLKIFLYLSDVDEECGPFIYVKGSSPTSKSKFSKLFPQIKPKGSYPNAFAIEKLTSKHDIFQATAPLGTIIFCDTAGIHKGGLAKSKNRIMATGFYPSFRYTAGRNFSLSNSSIAKLDKLDPLVKKIFMN
jgi:hypothetical protein